MQTANAANTGNIQREVKTLYVVQPRSLQSTTYEIALKYTTNSLGVSFTVNILKPESYGQRAQENDSIFENEHVRFYLSPNTDKRNLFVFGVNHQNAYFDGIHNDQSGLTTDWNGQWTYSVERYDDYWLAKGQIPWSNFSFQSEDELKIVKLGFAKHGNYQQRILATKSV